MFKQTFAPKIQENETINSYLNLVYRPLISENIENEVNVEDDLSSISNNDNNILTAKN